MCDHKSTITVCKFPAVICVGASFLPLSFVLHCSIELLTKDKLQKLPSNYGNYHLVIMHWTQSWLFLSFPLYEVHTNQMHSYQVSKGLINVYLNSL